MHSMARSADRSVDVLLVGGGVASVRCARTLRRHGFAGSILLVAAEAHAPYNRPPLSKEVMRAEVDDALTAAEPFAWYARKDVELLLGARIVELDADGGYARTDAGARITFDRALIATGAEPRRPPIPGAERALVLRTLDDARRIRDAVRPGMDVAIVGGGFIGIELASSLAARGAQVTIAEQSPRLWGGALGIGLSDWAVGLLEGAGVRVLTGRAVERIEPGGVLPGGESIPAELVIAGVGVVPRVELAMGAGLEVDDGIVTDAEQRTSHPGIWAAGDVARSGERRVEHWHAAREAGERAALSMLAQPVPPVPVPWVFSEVAGVGLDVIGDALSWDEERVVADGSVVAYLAGKRLLQVAVIGSVVAAERARELVGQGVGLAEVEGLVAMARARAQ